MKKAIVSVLAACGVFAVTTGVLEAQTHTRTVESATVARPNGTTSNIEVLKTGRKIETVNCRDYNMLEESYRPQAVVYAANYGPKGKPHPTVTTEGVERIVPVVTASCRARPGDHFTTAVHNAMMPAH